MAIETGIEWCRSTFNPWWGCTKVSPGCDHCYAERDAHRFGTGWGPDQPRRFFSDKHWNEPRRWNEKARQEQLADAKAQWRVFCASMGDVFDNAVPQEHRDPLWALIRETPHLTWLVLTKRIGNAAKMLPADWGDGYPNVWLGSSIVNQEEADRDIPKLLNTPAVIRFLSMEPLLGAVHIGNHLECNGCGGSGEVPDDQPCSRCGHYGCRTVECSLCKGQKTLLHWVIVGGESGPNARPMHPDWARKLRDQCAAAGVPFLFKQWGEWCPRGPASLGYPSVDGVPRFRMTDAGYNGQVLGSDGGNDTWMNRAGKKTAGRLLDGVLHDGYPEVQS